MSRRLKLMLGIFVVFLIWMTFFDGNSYLFRNKLDNEIEELNKDIEYYKSEIEKDQKMINDLNNYDSLEKFAREKYKMKRENEDIFLIEFDTIKK